MEASSGTVVLDEEGLQKVRELEKIVRGIRGLGWPPSEVTSDPSYELPWIYLAQTSDDPKTLHCALHAIDEIYSGRTRTASETKAVEVAITKNLQSDHRPS